MKDVDRLNRSNNLENSIAAHSRMAKFFNVPLSDANIISLQNLLMTPSVHYIKTENVATGRFLMNTFLDALNHYHNIGCLTVVDNYNLKSNILDFATLKTEQHQLIDTIENFCIENPYIDFVWVELTETLLNQISPNQLNRFCELFGSTGQTPVIMMSFGS